MNVLSFYEAMNECIKGYRVSCSYLKDDNSYISYNKETDSFHIESPNGAILGNEFMLKKDYLFADWEVVSNPNRYTVKFVFEITVGDEEIDEKFLENKKLVEEFAGETLEYLISDRMPEIIFIDNETDTVVYHQT